MEKINIGMGKQEVLDILGKPIHTSSQVEENGNIIFIFVYPSRIFSPSGHVVYFDTNYVVVDISTRYN